MHTLKIKPSILNAAISPFQLHERSSDEGESYSSEYMMVVSNSGAAMP